MQKKGILILFLFIFSLTFIQAQIYNDCNIYGNCQPVKNFLSQLQDVSISSLEQDDILAYDSSIERWINKNFSIFVNESIFNSYLRLDADNDPITGNLTINAFLNVTKDLYVRDIFASNNSIWLGATKLTGNGTSLVVEDGNVTGDYLFGDGSAITNLNLTNVSIDGGQINASEFYGDSFFGGTFYGNLTNFSILQGINNITIENLELNLLEITGDLEVGGNGNFSGTLLAKDLNLTSPSSINFFDVEDFIAKLFAQTVTVLNITRNVLSTDASSFAITTSHDGTTIMGNINTNPLANTSSSVIIVNSDGNGMSLLKFNSNGSNQETAYLGNNMGNLKITNQNQNDSNLTLGFNDGTIRKGFLGDLIGVFNQTDVMVINNKFAVIPFLTNFFYPVIFRNNVTIDSNLNVTGNITLGDKITFRLGETIDNLIDGTIRFISNVFIDGELNMNNNNITNILSTIYNITGCNDNTAGTLCYDTDFDTLRFVTTSGQVLQVNQETTMPGKNIEGLMVSDSSIVYIIGATGINPSFKLAKADNLSTSGLMGVVTKDCNNNQVCPVIYFGIINDIDTSMYSEGTHLYLSDNESGNFTTIPPLFPSNPIWVATAIRVHATEGSIFVFPRLDSSNGITMNTLGLVGDFIQTDYKIRSLEGHVNMGGKNVMCIEMNGTTGEDICHVTFQPGGMGQASIWTRSGIVVPEAPICLNNTNRTDSQCWADVGDFTWNMDFNTSIKNGADWGITGDGQVIKDFYVGENTRLGNISGGNYAEFNTNGTLELNGNARVRKEIQLNIRNAVKGASAPTELLRDFGASGTVKIPVLQFSKVTQQDIYGEFHPKSEMDESINVEFHVMWIPGSGWTSGNYTWCLEYLVKNEESDYNTGTPITICDGGTPTNATQMIETRFTNTIDLNDEEVITAHFYRDVANDDGDDGGDVRFIEISYVANKLGMNMGESI